MSLRETITSKLGQQMLAVKSHSPVLLLGAGAVGFVATTVLACRATLKLSDVLAEGEEHLKKVEVTLVEDGEEKKKASFGVQLQTAIKIARLYAPAVAVGTVTFASLFASHVILKRRNIAITAAYAVVDRTFKEYRARVIAEQGEQKDLEYRFGVVEREIAVEGPDGIETKVIRGLDQEAVKKSAAWAYARVFDQKNDNWSPVSNSNSVFILAVQSQLNDRLRLNGFVFLNEAYQLLGFPRTQAGNEVGWVKNPKPGKGDGQIYLGTWDGKMYQGVEWVNGDENAILIDFNVDGVIADVLEKM